MCCKHLLKAAFYASSCWTTDLPTCAWVAEVVVIPVELVIVTAPDEQLAGLPIRVKQLSSLLVPAGQLNGLLVLAEQPIAC